MERLEKVDTYAGGTPLGLCKTYPSHDLHKQLGVYDLFLYYDCFVLIHDIYDVTGSWKTGVSLWSANELAFIR